MDDSEVNPNKSSKCETEKINVLLNCTKRIAITDYYSD